MNRMEHRGEIALIEALRSRGLKAHHMDTALDGMPDILVMGERVLMIEMKRNFKRSELIRTVMEPTQPVFMHDAHAHGYHGIYLCVYKDGKGYDLYRTEGILIKSMAGERLSDLVRVVAGAHVHDIAEFCMEKCKNRIDFQEE